MTTRRTRFSSLLRLAIVALAAQIFWALPLAIPAHAQGTNTAVSILYSFGITNSQDARGPETPLVQAPDGNFYGTTILGGTGIFFENNQNGDGTVFKVTPSGQESVIFSFAVNNTLTGVFPDAGLIIGPDQELYSLAGGGSGGQGLFYKIGLTGQQQVLYNFLAQQGNILDSNNPVQMILGSDGNFYGVGNTGGRTQGGTIFKITPSGQETVLHFFGDGSVQNDGANPDAVIQGSDGNLYGTTTNGGTANSGAVFKSTLGGQVTVLHSFGDGSVSNDASVAVSPFVEGADGNFYGTSLKGGSANLGTAFKVTPSGQVTILHSFGDGSVANDGTVPVAGLTLGTDGFFYGVTTKGGSAGDGTVFRMTPAGTITILHSFNDGSIPNDGTDPIGALIQASDGSYYGTTAGGGASGDNFGTVFKLFFIPPPVPTNLTATPGNGQISLSWNSSAGANTYNVYRSLTPGGEGSTPYQTGITGTAFTDTAVSAGSTYYYQVTAVETSESTRSNEASATLVPAPPANLVAIAGNGQVGLSWAASQGATAYNIYRGTTSGAESLYQAGLTNTGYTDTTVTNGVTYFYKVTAINGGGEGSRSNEASATPETPIPPAPTGLIATAGNAQVALSWTASTGATSYNVYRSTTSGSETLYQSGVKTTSLTDTAVVNGTTYFYEVTAVSGGGESGKSNEASATPEPPIPPAPTGLSAAGGNGQVVLSWSASTGATSYNVYRGTSSGAEMLYQSGITNAGYTDTAVTNDTTYFYEVTAVNGAGEGGKSNEASATPFAPIVYQAGLQMISSPYAYPGVALSTLFGYANPTLAVWSSALNSYILTPTSPADQISLGQGYWVRFPQVVTTMVPGTPAPTNQNFDIPLAKGWNMIGDPFLSPIPVANLTFNGGSETFTQATTGANPLIGATLWGYPAGSTSYTPATSLVPQGGYWIFAFSATDVQAPHP